MATLRSYGPPHGGSRGGYRRERRRAPMIFVAIVVVLVMAAAAAAVVIVKRHDREIAAARAREHAQATATVSDYLARWARGDLAGLATDVPPGTPDVAAVIRQAQAGLHVVSATYTSTGVDERAHEPSASFHAALVLQGLGSFGYDGTLPLRKVAGRWLVDFRPSAVHPRLAAGHRLAAVRKAPIRARVVFRDGSTPITGTDGELSGNLVGAVAQLTPAQAAATKGLRSAGDVAGVTGLERVYDEQLGGRAGGAVQLIDGGGAVVTTLHSFPEVAGRDLRTTLDLRIQRAGETALAGLAQPGSLVAMDTATGQVLALVNAPLGGYGRALRGTYPPGSTFKIVTTTAALMSGKTADTPLNCTESVTVDGLTFHNAEHEQLGVIPLHQAFAASCNVAFIRLEESLPAGAVGQAARLFGFNGPDLLPIKSPAGSYPDPTGPVEAAAQALGQGRDIESPLQNASIAAAVASGAWHQPTVTTPAPPGTVTHPLPAAVTASLRSFMREVVTSGTGTAADLPGVPVFGKTGTAEFGGGNPPKTHAWFVGYRGSVAFAVVVEGGGFGGAVAAPIAARFLELLGS